MNRKLIVSYLLGVGSGIALVKIYPKWRVTKIVQFSAAIIRAQKRLSKILIEEYYRIDDAIEAEQAFLNVAFSDLAVDVTFSVKDNGEDRKLHTQIIKRIKRSNGGHS